MKKILFAILALMIVPQISFGAVTYSRSPSGTTVTSPVTITVSFDDYVTDTGCLITDTDWNVEVASDLDVYYPSNSVAVGINTGVFPVSIPAGTDVVYTSFSCGAGLGGGNTLEENSPINLIFTIIGSSVLFGATTGSDLMASVGGVSNNVYTSALPYLLLSTGVFVGFLIIQKLVDTLALAYDQKMGREPRVERKRKRGRKKKET